MNRVEPNVADVDFVDALLVDKMAAVDWHALSEEEAAKFGLRLGFYRDQYHVLEQRDVAWKTMAMSTLSMAIIALSLSFLKVGAQYILIAVIFTQMARMGVLCHKMMVARRNVKSYEADVVEEAQGLADAHPRQDA